MQLNMYTMYFYTHTHTHFLFNGKILLHVLTIGY